MGAQVTNEYTELLRSGFPRHTSEVLPTPEEVKRHPLILLDLTEDAVIIYDRGGFLASGLESLRRKLKEVGRGACRQGIAGTGC